MRGLWEGPSRSLGVLLLCYVFTVIIVSNRVMVIIAMISVAVTVAMLGYIAISCYPILPVQLLTRWL